MFFLFQAGMPSMDQIMPIIVLVSLILGDILIFKITLKVVRAQVKTNMKWVAISFIIQFGIIFFISSPIILMAMVGEMPEGPDPGLIIPIVIIAVFIDFNFINVIHKIGLLKSAVIGIILFVPIFFAMFYLGSYIGSPTQIM